MATGGLIGTIGALWGKYGVTGANLKRAAYALGKARESFSQLSREVFYTIWNRAESRAVGSKALAQLQNPNYRPGKASTVFTEFHVPEKYRYTYRINLVNMDGLEKTIHASIYHDQKLTRSEAEALGETYGATLAASGTSVKGQPGESFEYANSRWVLFEENIAEE